jgi:hypothetical protein
MARYAPQAREIAAMGDGREQARMRMEEAMRKLEQVVLMGGCWDALWERAGARAHRGNAEVVGRRVREQ